MIETGEFDYEYVVKICTAQELVLENSRRKRQEDGRDYEKTLEEYRKAKETFLKTEEKQDWLVTQVQEKVKLTSYFNQQQAHSTQRIECLQNEICDIDRETTENSCEFDNSIHTLVTRFQNVGAEFDESIVLSKITECLKQAELVKTEIEKVEEKCRKRESFAYESEFLDDIRRFKELQNEAKTTKMQLQSRIGFNEHQVLHIQSNIDFLKQKNSEWDAQFNAFN